MSESLTAARGHALSAVESVLTGESRRLPEPPSEIPPREAGLARSLSRGAIRHRPTIEHVVNVVNDSKPFRAAPRVRAALLVGAYQLIWLTRIPAYAAIDASVEFVRRALGARAGGFTNALLRRVERAIQDRVTDWRSGDAHLVRTGWSAACRFRTPVLPDPALPAEHLAAATGEFTPRVKALVDRFGRDVAEQICWANQAVAPLVIHRNSLRISAADFSRQVRELAGSDVEIANDAAYFPPDSDIVRTPLFSDGLAYAQDATARRLAELAELKPGQRALDMCAAPGGKSAALAMQADGQAYIVAADINVDRLERLRSNVQRLQLPNVAVCRIEDVTGEFDAVLIDAPCSNSGVLARRPEARFRLRRGVLQSLVALQADLLRRGAAHVRAGGRLVYTTCSIEEEENEAQVQAFLRASPGWRIESQNVILPHWGERFAQWRDGGFGAVMVR